MSGNLTQILATAAVVGGFLLASACSAPVVVDPNKDARERAEMRAREGKETRNLNRAVDRVEQDREDGVE